ncbi:transmembrane protein 53 isoform X2 [Thalassophryne amazonica]|uniref:transmembrane protein 53 isoform X2 n=1 Tax=Thalassophryne amazonica TaxID=390379 RepID=UPI00147179CB|nr:transmembrane protein 53 isoform X2 [Thalassophryne amazonica]
MEDDEIDYNVVFPDAVTSERHWQGTKEPVVILLGWAGSKDKHLSKYSNIYNEQGCVTIGYTAPLKTVFISESFGYKELRNIAMKLLEILYDYEVENSPIFFHIFSNVAVFLLRIVLYPLTKYIHKNHYDAVRDRPPAWPHLFLYSSADQVIRHTDIEAFVETIQQKGVQADHVDFVSSPHVSHFRDFPEQYALKCRNFLVGCMKNVEGTEKKRHHIDNH